MEIIEVVAEGVLDRYSYRIGLGEKDEYSADGRMRVLYAPNGRGKTNMLNALANLLSPSREAFAALCDSPLRALKVVLTDQSTITFRKVDPFDGSYDLEIHDINNDPVHAHVDQEVIARRPQFRMFRDNPELERASSLIKSLHPGAIWIGADRLNPQADEEVDDRYMRRPAERATGPRRDALRVLLERIEKLFSNSALKTVTRDQNQVYGRLTNAILTGKSKSTNTASEARSYLEQRIADLLARGEGSAKYGLISLSELTGISEQLSTVRQNKSQLKTLRTILEPYFEILEKQIEAMEPTRHSVEAFVSSSNGFLDDKRVEFNSGEGITLYNDSGLELAPRALSSGEKHILLLLAQAVVAADQHKLLVIDEPEISLGIDWQRRLLANLLTCSSSIGGALALQDTQVLVATHSLQVMGEVETGDIVTVSDSGAVCKPGDQARSHGDDE
ncbi:ATP-binding protein [Brachybacterium alimentarium]|uniref:AAA family ATPase n=1 Tax=Brachybacterium alimentarium TaxID=47845 RepID=UPI000DF4092E|nr:AAA family ATPase [Brachybacterium alimentarium]RCS67488.1 ATP-binding protein [Brachybacterium alimentarium]